MNKRLMMALLALTMALPVWGEGVLHADSFGNVYVGNSAFAIGKLERMVKGTLYADTFGNVYAKGSAFPVGKLDRMVSGTLHADAFGRVFAGDNAFEVDISSFIKKR